MIYCKIVFYVESLTKLNLLIFLELVKIAVFRTLKALFGPVPFIKSLIRVHVVIIF